MRADVATDLGVSADAFDTLVCPVLLEWLGGDIVRVEDVTATGLAASLDTLAGIDAWHVVRSRTLGMRGIASRVQQAPRGWDAFTVRYSRTSGAATEYEKRMAAIGARGAGWLYPSLTVQAYVCDGRLLSMAAVRTDHLMYCISGGTPGCEFYWQSNPADGNVFAVVPWDDDAVSGLARSQPNLVPFSAHGHPIRIYRAAD